MYTIKTVTTLTGISSETLRAWERRYGTVTPVRDAKGRRLYSQEDVERLALLANATQQGFTISKIAGLAKAELLTLINDAPHTINQAPFFIQVVDALIQYRMEHCETLLKRALVSMDPLSYARDILQPTLQKVGDLWHEGKITITQEHLFSACVKRIILSLVNNMQSYSGPNPRFLFATLSGESHEFGILLPCLLATSQQCSSYYVGPDLPWDDLVRAADQLRPSVIVLSAINTPPPPDMRDSLANMANTLPPAIQLWLGGPGALYLYEHQQLPDRYHYISSLDDFNNRVAGLIAQSP